MFFLDVINAVIVAKLRLNLILRLINNYINVLNQYFLLKKLNFL